MTGFLGIVMAVVIFFGIKEVPRGKSEPEFEGMEEIGQVRFNWAALKDALKKKTMWFVFLQGFAGVFPVERDHILLLWVSHAGTWL